MSSPWMTLAPCMGRTGSMTRYNLTLWSEDNICNYTLTFGPFSHERWQILTEDWIEGWTRRSLTSHDTISLESSLINVSFVVLLLILNQRWRIQSKNVVRTTVYQGDIVLLTSLEFSRPSFRSEYLLVFFWILLAAISEGHERLEGLFGHADTSITPVCFFP